MQHLGQHFLKNKEILAKIVDALNIKSGDIIIEIGPGHGELTTILGDRVWGIGGKIIVIEKDQKLTSQLRDKWRDNRDKIEIVEGNALKVLKTIPDTLNPKPYKIVGNIPYYITGHLLRILCELPHKPERIVLLIQREVAGRIAAEPPEMNLLAAVTQSWAKPEIIARVGRGNFSPPPKVDSAVIVLRPIPDTPYPKPYFEFLRILFKQPRKTVLNNLMANNKLQMTKNELAAGLKRINVDPNARPQNLSLEEIQNLWSALYNETNEEYAINC